MEDESRSTIGTFDETDYIGKSTDEDDNDKRTALNSCTHLCHATYPRRVFFVVAIQFTDFFCFYGIVSVLQSYLMLKLGQPADTAAALYHTYVIISYFMALPGGVIADSFFGRFYTIIVMLVVYTAGNVVMSATSIGTGSLVGALVGVFTVAIATGGVKACHSAFGADQFSPEQLPLRRAYFSFFYVSGNVGSVLSQFLLPLIKVNSCFGESECWVLTFGIPAALLALTLGIFLIGTKFYNRVPVKENVALKMGGAVFIGLGRSFRRHRRKVDHWLDRAVPEYTQKFVEDCKAVLRVLILYLPLPFFSCLFDQQGSRWTYQAQKMNSYIDFLDIHIEAEQVQTINGFIVVVFAALFDWVIYPLSAKCNFLTRPLQRMVSGCALAALSFIFIGVIQISVQESNDLLEWNNPATFRTRIFNVAANCSFDIAREMEPNDGRLEPYDTYLYGSGKAENGTVFHFRNITCNNVRLDDISHELVVDLNRPISSIFFGENRRPMITYSEGSFPVNENGEAQNEFLHQLLISSYTPLADSEIEKLEVVRQGVNVGGIFKPGNNSVANLNFTTGTIPSQYYQLSYTSADDNKTAHTVDKYFTLLQGGAYTFYLTKRNGSYDVELLVDKQPNAVSIAWQLLPYFALSFAEIMFSITGLSFAFSQAPATMKSILTACWQLNSAFGNIIALIIISFQIVDKAVEFFLFAALMACVTVIFAVLSYFYVYVEDARHSSFSDGDTIDTKPLIDSHQFRSHRTYQSFAEPVPLARSAT